MKIKSIAALIGAAFAVPAFAQSSITIYGIADAGVHVSSNGEGTKTKLVSGIADGSRLGFKGTEDLGGGYKAIFNLEARLELDTGDNKAKNLSDNTGFALTRGLVFPVPAPSAAPLAAAASKAALAATNPTTPLVNSTGAIFDRTSMVGLITPFGAILAGRMYTPGYEILAGGDTFETGTAGAWGSVTGGAAGLLTAGVAIRSDKALQYRIELPNGIGAALMYGFKNSGYIGLDDKFWAANVKYKANGFDVGAGYNHGTDQNGNSGLITWTVAGSYALGDMKFFGGYHNMKNENSVLIPVVNAGWDTSVAPLLAAAAGPAGAPLVAAYTAAFKAAIAKNFYLDAASYTLGMQYRLGAGRILGSISRVDDKTAFDADATQYAIGYDHNLSKRTDIYTVLAYIKNNNSAQYASGAASASGGFTSAAGESSKTFQIGMRHKF